MDIPFETAACLIGGQWRPTAETLPLFEDPFVLAVPTDDPRPAAVPIEVRTIDRDTLILLEEGHCLRDQALAVCAGATADAFGLGATSLATVVQLVASGYGTTLLPRVAAAIERDNPRIKLLRFVAPEPRRTIGLAFRRTSPRKADFFTLARRVVEALGMTGLDPAALDPAMPAAAAHPVPA